MTDHDSTAPETIEPLEIRKLKRQTLPILWDPCILRDEDNGVTINCDSGVRCQQKRDKSSHRIGDPTNATLDRPPTSLRTLVASRAEPPTGKRTLREIRIV